MFNWEPMTKRNQIIGSLGRHDARKSRDREHLALLNRTRANGFKCPRLHIDKSDSYCAPSGGGLTRDVHHFGRAFGVDMRQFLNHSRSVARGCWSAFKAITILATLSLGFACSGAQIDYVARGQSAIEGGNVDQAEADARRALANQPGYRPALELLANARRARGAAALEAGDYEQAFKSYKLAATVEPARVARAEDWQTASGLAIDLGLRSDAVECIEHAIEADPTSLTARTAAGTFYDEDSDPARAIPHYLYVWEADRSNIAIGLRLSQLYVAESRPKDAVAVLEAVLAQDKANTQAMLALAEALEQSGDKKGAKRVFKRLTKEHSDHAGVLLRYAEFLERSGQKSAARRWRKKAEKLLPGVDRRKMRKLR